MTTTKPPAMTDHDHDTSSGSIKARVRRAADRALDAAGSLGEIEGVEIDSPDLATVHGWIAVEGRDGVRFEIEVDLEASAEDMARQIDQGLDDAATEAHDEATAERKAEASFRAYCRELSDDLRADR